VLDQTRFWWIRLTLFALIIISIALIESKIERELDSVDNLTSSSSILVNELGGNAVKNAAVKL
jgi:hypothetical protein